MGTGAVLAALLSVAACSGGGGASGTAGKPTGAGAADAGSVTALQQIRKRTGTVRSARIEGTTEMGDTVSMKQTGTIGWSDGLTGSLTLTYTGGTMAKALKQGGGGDGSVRARYLQDEYYADMGEAFAATIGGKRWVRYAHQDLAPARRTYGASPPGPPDLCLNLPHRGARRRICPARPRSRTLHKKPKTAGRRCALDRGTVTEGSARSDDLRR
ncbi:hypothetical protein ACG93S_01465 [Streptomyces sp. WAC01490]|uniref:hypothetical protein n=1 Tax=unclassified Streptomyces TaxID=2593676 RepID=UPI003F2F284F